MTPQQELFVEHYLVLWNATKAAIAAGYSAKTARQQGSRLLSNVDIRKAIAARIEETKVTADEILIRLADHSRGTMADFIKYDDDGQAVWFDLAKAKTANKLHLIKKLKFKQRAFEHHVESDMEIELYDAQAATTLLGKHHRLFERSGEIDWRTELERAGINASDEFERLVQRIAERVETSTGTNAGGSAPGSDAARPAETTGERGAN